MTIVDNKKQRNTRVVRVRRGTPKSYDGCTICKYVVRQMLCFPVSDTAAELGMSNVMKRGRNAISAKQQPVHAHTQLDRPRQP